MAFTYDLTTDIGKVRLLIADADASDYTFEDDEVAFAVSEEADLKCAAALLLESLAANRSRLAVRVSRGVRTEDLTQVSKELAARAKELREQSGAISDVPLEAVITPTVDAFSYRQNLLFDRESAVRTP